MWTVRLIIVKLFILLSAFCVTLVKKAGLKLQVGGTSAELGVTETGFVLKQEKLLVDQMLLFNIIYGKTIYCSEVRFRFFSMNLKILQSLTQPVSPDIL